MSADPDARRQECVFCGKQVLITRYGHLRSHACGGEAYEHWTDHANAIRLGITLAEQVARDREYQSRRDMARGRLLAAAERGEVKAIVDLAEKYRIVCDEYNEFRGRKPGDH